MKIQISVPATSANLGPGFDTLGLALNWRYTYKISTTVKNNEKDIKSKMVQKGFSSIFQYYGTKKIPIINVTTTDNILIGKGLGTSAACYLAGIEAANNFLNNPFKEKQILDQAINIEGHADNIMPAYFGGLQLIVKNKINNEIINYKIKVKDTIKIFQLYIFL